MGVLILSMKNNYTEDVINNLLEEKIELKQFPWSVAFIASHELKLVGFHFY